MPLSSAISAGAQGLASQYNNLRTDALGLVEVTSGGAFSASRVIIETATGFVLFDDTLTVESPQFVFSAEAASGAAETVEVYKPGAVIGGFSGMTPGTPYYSNSSGTLTTTAHLVRIVMARAISATEMIFNPEVSSFQFTSGTYTGTGANRSDMVYLTSAGGWERLTATTPNIGQELIVGQLLKTVASPGTAVAVALSNQVISGFSSVRGQTLVAGTLYYGSADGVISSTKSGNATLVGIGRTANELFLFPGNRRDGVIIETVLAGENWTVANLLYQKSDGLWYKADSDVAESGICERPAYAYATHTGGASSSQLVYMPSSVIRGVFTLTTGTRYYPSPTAGSRNSTTPASYDTYYRQVSYASQTDVMSFQPQEMIFLPTGIQEKGQCTGGGYGAGASAGGQSLTPVNFKKIMSNTPSSITFTRNDLWGGAVTGPSAESISRFGFNLYIRNNSGSTGWGWGGTYQTVGN